MVASIDSPRLGGGNSSLFPSPPHVHSDTASAIRSLRRSLSRSPSKGPRFHLVPSTSSPPRGPSPDNSALASPSLSPQPHSPLATPFPPSARVNRNSVARKTYSMRSSSQPRAAPGDPSRRPLFQSRHHGNAAPSPASNMSTRAARLGWRETRSASPATEGAKYEESQGFKSSAADHDRMVTSNLSVPAFDTGFGGASHRNPSTASPLKRTESIIDLASHGSPVAKRRSLHGASFGADFNIFEQVTSPARDAYEMTTTTTTTTAEGPRASMTATTHHASLGGGSSPFFASMPKRASSLRRSTLQQRHQEKPTYAQSRPNPDLAFELANAAPSNHKMRGPRLSADHVCPMLPRDSPFAATGPLPSASAHMLPPGRPNMGQPHPLSHAISPSSSHSSVVEESSPPFGHVGPRPPPDRSAPTVDFTKSLPVGALRPSASGASSQAPSGLTNTNESSFATPPNYRLAKPLPAAFMSTGLISKRNRDPMQLRPGAGAKAMPDTPCKRPSMNIQAVPFPTWPGRSGGSRPGSADFGSPSTPLHGHRARLSTGGAGAGIFGGRFVRASLPRRSSFLGSDIDDSPPSPLGEGESQPSDYELPPTPTKPGSSPKKTPKSQPMMTTISHWSDRLKGNGATFGMSRSVGGRAPSFGEMGSQPFMNAGEPLDFAERLSPQTPQESMVPPDPSGLSISGHDDHHRHRHDHASIDVDEDHRRSSSSVFPPATPTAVRGFQPPSQSRFPSLTPTGSFVAHDVDPSLTSRFDQVELIGTGEFSQVYRVARGRRPASSRSHRSPVAAARGGHAEHVYAVKKSRRPYMGMRDRKRKLQEVQMLQALGLSDHTVHLMDSWEERDHLYIQTEFCEEGSLDLFLAQVGRKARLDDFRIWKIMLELCLGVQHIHNSGIIHLDLKPANVLITFEGVLKIGDFGMATYWPAQAGIEAEGDREYIGPEILMGQFDKPADIFALGLMMLEIAGNVELPDNGPSWQKLRTGDMSDVPSLTWSSASNVLRDSSGNPVSPRSTAVEPFELSSGESEWQMLMSSPGRMDRHSNNNNKHDRPGVYREGELRQPPSFMVDPHHEQTMDRLVRWMISPNPDDRPVVDQLLDTVGIKWAEARRRAGATVFEGNWGPGDEVLGGGSSSEGGVDSVMMDV
ncbi:MAG: hypothetical protein M1823_004899 [Watsoniomyces obsoletus]|nr:MAG: hypothetical protein M1823_004899 [Watsoniomyces obsoletus]